MGLAPKHGCKRLHNFVGIFCASLAGSHVRVLRHDSKRSQLAIGDSSAGQTNGRAGEARLCKHTGARDGLRRRDHKKVGRCIFDADIRNVGDEACWEGDHLVILTVCGPLTRVLAVSISETVEGWTSLFDRMSQRIDIELTSESNGTWTWRAAGARQPKGTLEGSLLYDGARVGDVVRAELERLLDSVAIVSVVPPKSAKARPETLEIQGRPEPDYPTVNVQYAEGGRGRGDGERRERRPRPDGAGGREGAGGRDGGRNGAPRTDRGARPDRGARTDRPAPTDRARVDRGPRPERSARPERPARDARDTQKRLTVKRVHRDALIDVLPVEERPVAEQLFRGGIPAVRQAIIDQNAQLKAAGQTEVPSGPLLAMADRLLPQVKQADWLDRAQATLEASDISMRDLRQAVSQADGVARDDASREMAAKLRARLSERVDAQRNQWLADIEASLTDGKLVRGVRLSGRVPDPSAKLSPELAARLVAATNAELSAETPAERWLSLVEAAAEAPFRRDVNPAGLPTKTSEAFLAAAAQASNRIPSLLKLLGLSIPPPPRSKATPPPPPARPIPAPPVPYGAVPVPTASAPAVAAAEPASAPVEAAPTDAAPTDPAPTDPAPTDPAPTDPAPTDPAPTDPAPTDAAPTDAAHTEAPNTEA